MDRTGVAGVAQNKGTINHIVLDDLYVHDVDGNVYNKHMANGGIYFIVEKPENESATGISKFDDLVIENCRVKPQTAGYRSSLYICMVPVYQCKDFG